MISATNRQTRHLHEADLPTDKFSTGVGRAKERARLTSAQARKQKGLSESLESDSPFLDILLIQMVLVQPTN